MGGEVKGPLGPDLAHDTGDGLGVVEVQFVAAEVGANVLDAPRLVAGPDQQVDFMAFTEQTPGEIGADKAGAAAKKYLHPAPP